MIEFDISKFRVECVYLKYISRSMGGIMSVLDTSNKSDEEKFKKMKENGADICFSKPLPLTQLKNEVARLLGLTD